MQQNELNRAVARATGETVTTVKRLGFLLDDPDQCEDGDVEIIDWDDLETQRNTAMTGARRHQPAAV